MTDNSQEWLSDVVARRIRTARILRGWTLTQLADRCAETGAPYLTRAVIANIECGRRDSEGRRRRDVTVDELEAFSIALGFQPGAVLACRDDEAALAEIVHAAGKGEQ